MLETSKDLLFITLAFCALLFTAFSCWLLYYFIAIIRDAYDITKSIKRKIDMIDDILKTIKNSISNATNYIGLIVASTEKIIDYLGKKKNTSQSRKKAKAKTVEE